MGDTGTPDLLMNIINLSYALPAFFRLTRVVMTFVGVWMFIAGLLDLYNYNNDRYNGPRKTLGGIFTKFLVSTVLISSVYMLVATGNTLVGTSSAGGAMLYSSAGMTDLQLAAVRAIFGMFMLGGYIWFCFGWIQLDKHFNGGRDGVWGPILHIIAGTGCVFMEEWVPLVIKLAGLSNVLVF